MISMSGSGKLGTDSANEISLGWSILLAPQHVTAQTFRAPTLSSLKEDLPELSPDAPIQTRIT